MRSKLLLLSAVSLLVGAAAPSMLHRLSLAYTSTANMGLSLPTPGVDTGPGWASALNAAFTVVDSHNHTSGHGVQVPTAGIGINASLPMANYGVKSASYLQFQQSANQSVIPTEVTNRFLYQSDVSPSSRTGDLWYVDGLGNDINITCGGVLCIPNAAGFGGNYGTDTAFPSASYTTATKNYTFTTDGTTLAGISGSRQYVGVVTKTSSYTVTDTDQADVVLAFYLSTAITITLPAVSTNLNRLLTIKDSSGTAMSHTVTIARAGSAHIDGATSVTVTANYGVVRLVCDGANWWTI